MVGQPILGTRELAQVLLGHRALGYAFTERCSSGAALLFDLAELTGELEFEGAVLLDRSYKRDASAPLRFYVLRRRVSRIESVTLVLVNDCELLKPVIE